MEQTAVAPDVDTDTGAATLEAEGGASSPTTTPTETEGAETIEGSSGEETLATPQGRFDEFRRREMERMQGRGLSAEEAAESFADYYEPMFSVMGPDEDGNFRLRDNRNNNASRLFEGYTLAQMQQEAVRLRDEFIQNQLTPAPVAAEETQVQPTKRDALIQAALDYAQEEQGGLFDAPQTEGAGQAVQDPTGRAAPEESAGNGKRRGRP